MLKFLRIFTLITCATVGAGALYGGFSFISDPSGEGIGMSTSYLEHSAFSNYLIPGIILFIVNGVGNIITVIAAIKKIKQYPLLILIQGIILCGWIIAQVIMVRDISILHLSFFAAGIVLVIFAFMLRRYEQGSY